METCSCSLSFFTDGSPTARAASTARVAFDIAAGLARPLQAPVVTDADLAPLPEPVQRYLRIVGAVGQPKVPNYRLRFRGRIRSGPDASWMPFEVEQQSFADQPARLFLMPRAHGYAARLRYSTG